MGNYIRQKKPIDNLPYLDFSIIPKKKHFHLDIRNHKRVLFDDDLTLQDLKAIINHLQELYKMENYDESRLQQCIQQQKPFEIQIKNLLCLRKYYQPESLKYIPNNKIIIEEKCDVKTVTKNQEITFTKERVTNIVFELLTRTVVIKSPFFIKIKIENKNEEDYSQFLIYNFNNLITHFRWENIAKIPQITDAIKDLYELRFFDSQQINTNTEELIYISNVGQKSAQLFDLKYQTSSLAVEVKDLRETIIEFDWLKLNLRKISTKKRVTIPFSEIKKIRFHIVKDLKDNFLTLFDIKIWNHQKESTTLIEFDHFHKVRYKAPMRYKFKPISSIPPNLIFNSIIELVKILKANEELADIQIELLI